MVRLTRVTVTRVLLYSNWETVVFVYNIHLFISKTQLDRRKMFIDTTKRYRSY